MREGGGGWRAFRTQALVEVAVVELIERAGAEREHVRHERNVDDPFHELIEGAMLGVRAEDVHLAIEGLEARLLGDEAHRAAHRLRAIESALGTPQHFDARNVDDVRVERLEHRGIVDVEAGGVRALDTP